MILVGVIVVDLPSQPKGHAAREKVSAPFDRQLVDVWVLWVDEGNGFDLGGWQDVTSGCGQDVDLWVGWEEVFVGGVE